MPEPQRRSCDLEASNPFVFVVGCPRSGTTLLQRMLDSHPALAVANDSHFIPRCMEKVAPELVAPASNGAPVPLSTELVDGVEGYHRLRRLGLSEEQGRQAARGVGDYGSYVAALYTAFAARHGKRLGGEKTPDYVRRLPLLAGLFPEARFIHIIRDGRDVALSVMGWAHEKKGPGKLEMWADSPLATSALWWAWQVESGRSAGRALADERYLEVGYERLVREPGVELNRIASFLNLPFADEMLRYHEGKTRSDPGKSAKSNWLPPTPGLRNWRDQMTPRDVELFEALTGDLLDALDLRRGVAAVSPEAAAEAANHHACWQDHLRRRREKIERRLRRARGEVSPG